MLRRMGVNEFINSIMRFRPDNFSYIGLRKIFKIQEERYDGELFDIVVICTRYSEYKSMDEMLRDFGEEFENFIELSNGGFLAIEEAI